MALNDDAWLERVRAGREAYWANITSEQRAERNRRSAETRARNRQRYAEMCQAEAERHAEAERRRAQRRERRRVARDGPPAAPVFRSAPGSGGATYPWDRIPPKYLARRIERFWPYVDQTGGPEACWPWHGNRHFDSDYGQVSWLGQLTPSHRVAWSLSSGLHIPYELVVDHLCCCKWCQNPDHLEPVTRKENNRRTHHRPAEATRLRTSFDSPFEDRWYPFGRRLYDSAGNRIELNASTSVW